MYIRDVQYFKDREAEVNVSDGRYTVLCYGYPCDMVAVNQRVEEIDAFECENVMRSDETEYAIKKLPEYFAYQLVAKVVDNQKGIVRIGGLIINLFENAIPKDIMNGEYIEFSVRRLDL